VPHNAISSGGWNDPALQEFVKTISVITVMPYMKSAELLSSPVQQGFTGTDTLNPAVKPWEVGFTMNGMLHTYSATAVNNASIVPMIWTGTGNLKRVGRASANPHLICGSAWTGPCRFNPGGAPGQPLAAGNMASLSGMSSVAPNYRVYTHGSTQGGGGVLIARTDTSAKFQRVGVATGTTMNMNAGDDPFARVFNNGSQFTFIATSDNRCRNVTQASFNTGFRYACFFRPDRED
jgi:hypothetical protein